MFICIECQASGWKILCPGFLDRPQSIMHNSASARKLPVLRKKQKHAHLSGIARDGQSEQISFQPDASHMSSVGQPPTPAPLYPFFQAQVSTYLGTPGATQRSAVTLIPNYSSICSLVPR